jgi:hypothetical protein
MFLRKYRVICNEIVSERIQFICYYCNREIPSFLAHECSHCNETYCIDHFLPETHNCANYRPIQWNNEPTNLIPPEGPIPQTPVESEINIKVENEEQSISQSESEVVVTEKSKRHPRRLIYALFGIIILLMVVTIGSSIILQQNRDKLTDEKHTLENDLALIIADINNTVPQCNLISEQLTELDNNLQDNISKINLQKTGDIFSLHDPLLSDVTEFIAKDKSSDMREEINNAKQHGIYCSLVHAIINTSTNEAYELIAFNTTDMGMIYFEPVTDYRVFPILGYSYVDCVEGNPYYSTYDDTIKKLIVIW